MVKIEYLEDENGNVTKVLISDEKFKTLYLDNEKTKNRRYAIVITDEIQDAIYKFEEIPESLYLEIIAFNRTLPDES